MDYTYKPVKKSTDPYASLHRCLQVKRMLRHFGYLRMDCGTGTGHRHMDGNGKNDELGTDLVFVLGSWPVGGDLEVCDFQWLICFRMTKRFR